MGKGKIPACSVLSSQGTDTASGQYKNERKVNPSKVTSQASSGNKCAHNPKDHRFYKKPPGQKRRFHVLEESIRRIKRNLMTPASYPEFNQYLYNKEKRRKIRSEAREAELSLLLPAIADTVNLAKEQLGYWDGSVFINYNYKKYVELTGMSEIRVKRHMLALKKNGFIDVKVIVEELDDGYRTEKVIITVTDKLFTLLGLEREYLEDRERAIRNRNKIERQEEYKERCLSLYRAKKIKESVSISLEDNAIKDIGKALIKKIPPVPAQGNGIAIRNAITNLLDKGHTISEATQIVRKLFYPPS